MPIISSETPYYTAAKTLFDVGLSATKIVGAYTGLNVTERIINGLSSFSKYMAPAALETVKGYVLTLQNLGVQAICRDLQTKIIEFMQQSEFKDFFENFNYQEQDSDPKTVASIKRLMNILKEVEDTFKIVEQFDADSIISSESFDKLSQVLNKIPVIEESVRNLSHLLVDVQDYIQPVIGQIEQALPFIQQKGGALKDKIQDKITPIQALYAGEFTGIQALNRAVVISPYILQELTAEISQQRHPELSSLTYKSLVEKEQQRTSGLENLIRNAKDKTIMGQLSFYSDLSATMSSLLRDTYDIYGKYKVFSQELYEQGKANIDEIEFGILPQLQSQLEEVEEQLGLPPGKLVSEFKAQSMAQINQMRAQLDNIKKWRVMTMAYDNLVEPVIEGVCSKFSTMTAYIPKIDLGLFPTQASPQIDTTRLERYESAMNEMRMNRLKKYQLDIELMAGIEVLVDTLCSHLESGNEDEFRQFYGLIQPYLFARHPELDARIYAAITSNSPLPKQDILGAKSDIIREIRQMIAEHQFHKGLIEKRHALSFDPDEQEDAAAAEFREKVGEKIQAHMKQPIEKMSDHFYRQDLFTRIQQLKISEKIDATIQSTMTLLNQTVKPRILDEIGIAVSGYHELEDVIASYNPRINAESKQAKSYQRMMNAMVYLKDCLAALEKPDDNYQDATTEMIGDILTGLGGQDSKKVKYVLGKLYPTLTKGLWAYWELQALASDPLLKDAINEILASAEPMRELSMISGMMGLVEKPTEENTNDLDEHLSEVSDVESDAGSTESFGVTLGGLLRRTDTASQMLREPSQQNIASAEAEETIDAILADIKNVFLGVSSKTQAVNATKSTLKTILGVLEKMDYLGGLKEEDLALVTQKIGIIYQTIQKELLKLNHKLEIKSGLLPGALEAQLKLNLQVTENFVAMMRTLYARSGKVFDEEKLLSFCSDGFPPPMHEVCGVSLLQSLVNEINFQQKRVEHSLTELHELDVEQGEAQLIAFKDIFSQLLPYLSQIDAKYQNPKFWTELAKSGNYIEIKNAILEKKDNILALLENQRELVREDYQLQRTFYERDFAKIHVREIIQATVKNRLFNDYGRELGEYYGLIGDKLTQKIIVAIEQEPVLCARVTAHLTHGEITEATSSITRAFNDKLALVTEELALAVALQNMHHSQQEGQMQLKEIVLDATHLESNPGILKYHQLIQKNNSSIRQMFSQYDDPTILLEKLNELNVSNARDYPALAKLTQAYSNLLKLQARMAANDPRLAALEALKKVIKDALNEPQTNYQQTLADIQKKVTEDPQINQSLNELSASTKGKNKLQLLDAFRENLNLAKPATEFSLFKRMFQERRISTRPGSPSSSVDSSPEPTPPPSPRIFSRR